MAKAKKTNKQVQLSPQNYIRTKARSLPIQECMINTDWEKCGLAQILVSRKHKLGNYTLGLFKVDTYCLGVKDAFYRFNITEGEYTDFKDRFCMDDSVQISYDLAHNIIYGAVEYAQELGISPCTDFAIAKYLLEEDTDAIPLIEINFGYEDEPLLFALSRLELNKYLPILQRTKPDIKYMVNDGSCTLDNFRNNDENIKQMTVGVYQYQNPNYPEHFNSSIPQLKELFNPNNNIVFDPAIIRELLLADRDMLIQDLENLTLYEIGRTYPLINDEEWSEDFVATLQHTVMFLAELGSTKSLNVILQILRQNEAFFEYHFAEFQLEILSPAIFKLGINKLPELLDFMKEPGLEPINRISILNAVTAIAIKYPERREEVIAWYFYLMNFYIDHIDNNLLYDAKFGAFLMATLTDLKAVELLSEVEEMFATNQVDTLLGGDYQDVSDEILGFSLPYTGLKDLNIYDWYKSLENEYE